MHSPLLDILIKTNEQCLRLWDISFATPEASENSAREGNPSHLDFPVVGISLGAGLGASLGFSITLAFAFGNCFGRSFDNSSRSQRRCAQSIGMEPSGSATIFACQYLISENQRTNLRIGQEIRGASRATPLGSDYQLSHHFVAVADPGEEEICAGVLVEVRIMG